jgi:hypothetical protein
VRQPGPTGCLFRCLERAETGATLLINSSSSGRTANNHIHSNTRRTRLAGAATSGEHVRRACDPGVVPATSMEHRVLTCDPTVAGNHRQRTRTTPTCSLPRRSAVGLPPAGPWKCRPTTGRAVEVPSAAGHAAAAAPQTRTAAADARLSHIAASMPPDSGGVQPGRSSRLLPSPWCGGSNRSRISCEPACGRPGWRRSRNPDPMRLIRRLSRWRRSGRWEEADRRGEGRRG